LATRFQPEEYIKYFEDWNLVANAEIGPERRLRSRVQVYIECCKNPSNRKLETISCLLWF